MTKDCEVINVNEFIEKEKTEEDEQMEANVTLCEEDEQVKEKE